jgi:hypothetical protein
VLTHADVHLQRTQRKQGATESQILKKQNEGKGPLKANDWLTEILKVGGGKGGGESLIAP